MSVSVSVSVSVQYFSIIIVDKQVGNCFVFL